MCDECTEPQINIRQTSSFTQLPSTSCQSEISRSTVLKQLTQNGKAMWSTQPVTISIGFFPMHGDTWTFKTRDAQYIISASISQCVRMHNIPIAGYAMLRWKYSWPKSHSRQHIRYMLCLTITQWSLSFAHFSKAWESLKHLRRFSICNKQTPWFTQLLNTFDRPEQRSRSGKVMWSTQAVTISI